MQLQGTIIDSLTRRGIPYASVSIITPQGVFTGVGASANFDGQFYLDNPAADFPNYIQITSTGYQGQKAQLYEDFFIDYGNIFSLTRSVKELPPVVITSSGNKNQLLWLLPLLLLLKKKKATTGSIGKIDTGTIVLVGAGFLLIKGMDFIQKILDSLGLGQGPGGSEQSDPASPWKPDYWISHASDTKRAYLNANYNLYWSGAGDIYNAFQLFYDNFEGIMSVLNGMKTKSDISFLAARFAARYGVDMLSFLKTGGGIAPWDGLSDSHMEIVLNYVNHLSIT